MKTLLLLVLAVLAANAAVVKGPSTRADLNVGYLHPGDRLLDRSYYYQGAQPNYVQYKDATFNGNYTTRISAIQANEVGPTQYASASIVAGGIGHGSVTVRLLTARGYGFYYVLSIWGR